MNKSELLKLDPHGKININDYLAVLEKGSVEARFGGRAISKLQ
jgi:hypothetical protein